MSTIADRLAAAKAADAEAEQAACVELERRLKWIKPAGISARDLWRKLGSRGDVAALTRRLEALRDDGGRAVLVGELWYHGSTTLPNIRLPAVVLPPPPPTPAAAQAERAEERRAQALELLRAHPEGLKCREVAEHFGLAHTTAYNYLMRLRHDGLAVQDHNGLWRIAPPAPPPSQIAEPAPCTEEAPPPPATTVEIVAEGEVVAVVPEPAETETELRIGPDIDDERGIGAQRRYLRAARRLLESVEADLEQLTAPLEAEIARLRERLAEEESAYRAVETEREELRAELERVRAALRTLAAGGGS